MAPPLLRVAVILLSAHATLAVSKSKWSNLQSSKEWEVTAEAEKDAGVHFKLYLRECNLEEAERAAMEVSEPGSPQYRQFLTTTRVAEIMQCSTKKEDVAEVKQWLIASKPHGEHITNIKEGSNYVEVWTTVAAAQELFKHEEPRKLAFDKYQHSRDSSKEVVRARHRLRLPPQVDAVVDLVVGLHGAPPMVDRKYKAVPASGPRSAGPTRPKGVHTDPILMTPKTTETVVNPRLLQYLYGIPTEAPLDPLGRQALIEFDDFYSESDVCQAANLFGSERRWLKAPNITYYSDTDYRNTSDTHEATLDVEIMVNLGAGIPIDVLNLSPEEWILDWATTAFDLFAPEDGGPLVWSVSYGFPEAAQAMITGEDSWAYVERANVALMKLAMLGVTVLVASGDDGAPGYSFTCPSDPSWPILGAECPLPGGCGCADFVLQKEVDGEEKYCIVPWGLLYGQAYPPGTPGADCDVLLNDGECAFLLDAFSILDDVKINNCTYGVSKVGMVYSDCQCSDIGTLATEGACSIKGYTYDPEIYKSTSMFAPDFPASSPWVTAIGSTQVAANPYEGCKQGDILSQAEGREVATILFNSGGGFSLAAPQPSYQHEMVQRYLETVRLPPVGSFNASNRGYPDISAIGWYHLIIDQGRPTYVGGTSASAPVVASLVAMLNEDLLAAGQPPMGFLNPFLYHIATNHSNAFNKVKPQVYPFEAFLRGGAASVQGSQSGQASAAGDALEELTPRGSGVDGVISFDGTNNMTSMYNCRYGFHGSLEGWDPVTGLGTPNFHVWREILLSRQLKSLTMSAPLGPSHDAAPQTIGFNIGLGVFICVFFASLLFLWLKKVWRAKAFGRGLGLREASKAAVKGAVAAAQNSLKQAPSSAFERRDREQGRVDRDGSGRGQGTVDLMTTVDSASSNRSLTVEL